MIEKSKSSSETKLLLFSWYHFKRKDLYLLEVMFIEK